MTLPVKAKWTLPETINPTGRRCFIIRVPDERFHIAAFRGALLNLASGAQWADDPDHKARLTALIWADVIEEMEDCSVFLQDVRQDSPDSPCTLEKQVDGEWTPFANLQLCPPRLRVSQGVLEWFDGTSWQALPGGGDERQDGGSTPPWPTPPEGESGNCLAGENIAAVFDTTMEQMRAGVIAGEIGLVLAVTVTGILSVFIPAAVFAVIANSIGLAIAAGGLDLLDGCVDTDNLDALKCAVYCHANSDGSITASQFNAIYSELDTSITDSNVRSIYQYWLSCLGPVGLTRMGAAGGVTTGDCGSCGCATITASILFGIGSIDSPTTIGLGDTWTLHSGNNAGTSQFVAVEFNGCCHITVLSSSGWVANPTTQGSPAWRDCAGTDHNTSPDQPPEYLSSNLQCTRVYFVGAVGDPFTVIVRLESAS